jgi:hypothetical protein
MLLPGRFTLFCTRDEQEHKHLGQGQVKAVAGAWAMQPEVIAAVAREVQPDLQQRVIRKHRCTGPSYGSGRS